MRTIGCFFVAVALVFAAQSVFGEDSPAIKTDSLEITIKTLQTGKSFPAYIGDGKSLCNPMGGFSGGMSSIFMAKEDDGKTYSYVAGEAKAKENAILIRITIEAKNISATDQYLTIGDFTLDYGNSTTFLAVGYGEYPFIKSGAVKTALTRERNKIEPEDTRTLTYIFATPAKTREGRLVYKGKQSISVRLSK